MKKNELLQKDAPKSREEFSSRETVRMLLSSLIPAEESGSETSLPTKQNIDVLRNAISSLHEAAGEAILTDEEADALINLLVNRFVEKEIDRTVRRMLVPKKDRWFVIAAQSHHE